MPQFVMMPVKALNEKCVKCPRLDIDVNRMHIYSTETSQMENHIFCKNWEQCTYSYNMGLEDGAKATEKTAKVTDDDLFDLNDPLVREIIEGMSPKGQELVDFLIQKITDRSGPPTQFTPTMMDIYKTMDGDEKRIIEHLIKKMEDDCRK